MSVKRFKIGSVTEQYNYTALDNIPEGLQIQEYVNDWLNDHPEATTTVQDGATIARGTTPSLIIYTPTR